jgi:hypothetical protein
MGAFDRCFLALLASLWAEMEAVIVSNGPPEGATVDARAGLRAQALLLELDLLADRCDCARWRALISPAQIEQVRVVVGEVRARLDFDPLAVASARMHEALVDAQNYLFDLVQRRCLLLARRREGDHRKRSAEVQSPVDCHAIVIHDVIHDDGGHLHTRTA